LKKVPTSNKPQGHASLSPQDIKEKLNGAIDEGIDALEEYLEVNLAIKNFF
jgi:hypothetical protein